MLFLTRNSRAKQLLHVLQNLVHFLAVRSLSMTHISCWSCISSCFSRKMQRLWGFRSYHGPSCCFIRLALCCTVHQALEWRRCSYITAQYLNRLPTMAEHAFRGFGYLLNSVRNSLDLLMVQIISVFRRQLRCTYHVL